MTEARDRENAGGRLDGVEEFAQLILRRRKKRTWLIENAAPPVSSFLLYIKHELLRLRAITLHLVSMFCSRGGLSMFLYNAIQSCATACQTPGQKVMSWVRFGPAFLDDTPCISHMSRHRFRLHRSKQYLLTLSRAGFCGRSRNHSDWQLLPQLS